MVSLYKKNIPQLAKQTGVSKMTMYKAINGISKNLEAIKAFSDELDLDPVKAFEDVLRFNT